MICKVFNERWVDVWMNCCHRCPIKMGVLPRMQKSRAGIGLVKKIQSYGGFLTGRSRRPG